MNRKERRLEARRNKMGNQAHTIIVMVEPNEKGLIEISSNSGRAILTDDLTLYSLDLGMCLDHTLNEYGDISGIGKQAIVVLKIKNGLPHIEVDRDCNFQGYYNGFSGTLSAKACGLALTITLCSHFAHYIKEHNPQIAQSFSNHYHKLRDKAFSTLSDKEQCGLWSFLD